MICPFISTKMQPDELFACYNRHGLATTGSGIFKGRYRQETSYMNVSSV